MADEVLELGSKQAQLRKFALDFQKVLLSHLAHRSARTRLIVGKAEQFTYLVQTKAEFTSTSYEAQAAEIVGIVRPPPGCRSRRLMQQPAFLVEPDRVDLGP